MRNEKKELRNWIGAAAIFLLIVGLLVHLSIWEVPSVNKDFFVSISSIIASSLGFVIFSIIGKDPEEVQDLQKRNEGLQKQIDQLVKQKDELEGMLIRLQDSIIDTAGAIGQGYFAALGIEKINKKNEK